MIEVDLIKLIKNRVCMLTVWRNASMKIWGKLDFMPLLILLWDPSNVVLVCTTQEGSSYMQTIDLR